MEFFTVMGKVWTEYSSLFLHGLWMTLYMGALTVLISTHVRLSDGDDAPQQLGDRKVKPLHAAAVVYVEVIRGTADHPAAVFLLFYAPQLVSGAGSQRVTCCDDRLLRQLHSLCL